MCRDVCVHVRSVSVSTLAHTERRQCTQLLLTALTHQDEVSLIGGQHEHGDVLVSQWGNDRLGDLGHSNRLRAGEAATTGHHIQGQPGGICHTQVLRGGQFCMGRDHR